MTVHLPAAAYKAMQVQAARAQQPLTPQDIIDDLRAQVTKLTRERDAALARVEELEAENDKLALKAHRAGKINAAELVGGTFVDGRRVVNQVEAAAILKVEQYRISRWVAARKFEMTPVPGRKKPGIFADSLRKPEPGKPGRKKK